MIRDIKPKSPISRLTRDYDADQLDRKVDVELAAAVLGMSRAFISRALKTRARPSVLTIEQVLDLLDVDNFQETFVPRSKVMDFLLRGSASSREAITAPCDGVHLQVGDARDLIPRLSPGEVRCVMTSSPYWGMRLYENQRDVHWADGEKCPYGFEQTPEGFIRHTVELLHLLKPALTGDGSVWWNVMDTFNTRTPIRGSARERLDAMVGRDAAKKGWTEHAACRHSAGHMYLADGEQSAIPMRIAERASRLGYRLRSFITWRKNGVTPEPARSRVSRQAEYVIHLTHGENAYFDKTAWQELPQQLGGPDERFESRERITDVWSLPSAGGQNGHGAEFPLALPGRCIALSSTVGDLVLDPFVGSGTTALAAVELGRRCIGFDISDEYLAVAKGRVTAAEERLARDLLDANVASGKAGPAQRRRRSRPSNEQLEAAPTA
jgi:DNA modification methylase